MRLEQAGLQLPEIVQREARGFADVDVAWLAEVLKRLRIMEPQGSEARASAIFAAVSGAQLYARSRSEVSTFDPRIESYRVAGLLPACERFSAVELATVAGSPEAYLKRSGNRRKIRRLPAFVSRGDRPLSPNSAAKAAGSLRTRSSRSPPEIVEGDSDRGR